MTTQIAAHDIPTLHWLGGADGHLRMIDQTLLPVEFKEIDCRTVEDVWEAIKNLRVRGAPAIGIAAAFGVCLGLQGAADDEEAAFFARLEEVTQYLATSRPTAVNLFWALDRMKRVAGELRGEHPPAEILSRLLEEARAIQEEDRQMCRAIGRHGAALLQDGQGVLTHCNAGGLATADYGTALAVFFAAAGQGKQLHVYADETRPLLQGARLTTWELAQRGIDVTLICDSMAAQVMREGRVQAVVTGADRIAANGDVANKIGTYAVALAARASDVPFYVAAPTSTVDLATDSGADIPIEEREGDELLVIGQTRIAPGGVRARYPAFDVTPADLITAIITDVGVARPPYRDSLARLMAAR